MLAAQAARAGGVARRLGIARDERSEPRAKIESGLGFDVLLLSGGVSEGTHDLVPAELISLGRPQRLSQGAYPSGQTPLVRRLGGAHRASAGPPHRTFVFGLPGNPVSSMVCFELFVRPCRPA